MHERVNNMCFESEKREGGCLLEILSIIDILQRNACPEECILTCDKPVLGENTSNPVFNTRPVIIYSSSGKPFSMPISRENLGHNDMNELSSVFRVEKIDGKCVTFRVLTSSIDEEGKNKFVATNSYFTFDISCACALRCLDDCHVECI